MTLSHYERCQQAVRRLLNRLLRSERFREPYGHRAVTVLQSYVESPAFYPEHRQALIEDAYRVHNLPMPDDHDGWERRRLAFERKAEASR